MDKKTFKRLGNQLKSFRIEKRMTQPDLANKSGRSIAQIRSMEKGTSNPTLVMISDISRGLGKRVMVSFDDVGPSGEDNE